MSEIIESASGERNIKAAPVMHTTGDNGSIYIPDESKAPAEEKTEGRFISTGKNDVISTDGEDKTDAADNTSVSRYTDRLSVKPSGRLVRTGYTGKINTYEANHSAPAGGKKMISTVFGDVEIDAPSAPVSVSVQNPAQTVPAAVAAEENTPKESSVTAAEKAAGEQPFENITASSQPIHDATKQIDAGQNTEKEEKTAAADDNSRTKHVGDKGSLLRKIAGTADDDVRQDPDQLMMDGFGEEKEEEQPAGEEELIEELGKTRMKRINSFKFWGGKKDYTAETDDEKFSVGEEQKKLPGFIARFASRFDGVKTSFSPVDCDEYTDFNNRKQVFNALIDSRKRELIKAVICLAAGLICLISDLAAGVSAGNDANGFFTVFGGSYPVYVTVNLVCLIISAAALGSELKNGLFSLFKAHPKADTSLLFMYVFALMQNISAYFTQLKLEENFRMLMPAVILLSVPYLLAKIFYYDNIRHCFKAVAVKSDKAYLRRVSDGDLAGELLRDRNADGQNIIYAGRTKFISGFLESGENCAHAGMPSSRLVLAGICVAVIAGTAAALMGHSFVYGISAATLCLAFSFPVSCLASTGYRISSENRKLSVKSSYILGFSDARDFAAVDNIVADAGDLFSAEITNTLTSKGVSDKQAQFCAAVMHASAGGPLAGAFARTVSGLEDRFPNAENIVYEDKLGLSAWVSGCKVLVGTHALLENHNVQVPDESAVTAFLAEGEKPVYMALEGNFAAVFGVKYSCRENVSEAVRALVENGANILLCSSDANISDEYAELLLGCPSGSIRTVTSPAAEKFKQTSKAVTDSEQAGIVFTDSFDSLCRVALSAMRLDKAKRLAKLTNAAASVVGMLIAVVLVLCGTFAGTSPLIPVLLQSAWLALCFISPVVFSGIKTGEKKKVSVGVPSVSLPKISLGKKKNADDEEPEENAASVSGMPAEEQTDTAENFIKEETSVNAGPAVPPAENSVQTENEESGAQNTGVVTFETMAVLDALAGDVKNGTDSSPSAESKGNEEDEDGEEDEDVSASGSGKLGGMLRGFASGIKDKISASSVQNDSEDGEEDGETASQTAETPAKTASFLSRLPVKKNREKHLPDPEEAILSAAEREQAENEATRRRFTAPEMPKAPLYELGRKEEKPAEDPLRAKFVPPASAVPVNAFDDKLFSRFEDDKLFAGLYDEDGKRIN